MFNEVARLKRRASNAYQTYYDYTSDRGCGHALSQFMSPTASIAAREYDEAMTRLREIDPHCPKFTPLSRNP